MCVCMYIHIYIYIYIYERWDGDMNIISWPGRGSGLFVARSIEYENRTDWAGRGSGVYAAYRTQGPEQ